MSTFGMRRNHHPKASKKCVSVHEIGYSCEDLAEVFLLLHSKVPEKENPLPGFREIRLVYQEHFNSYPSKEQREKLEPVLGRIKTLLSHGFLGIDLIRCWVGWQIQPLSVRSRLMCKY